VKKYKKEYKNKNIQMTSTDFFIFSFPKSISDFFCDDVIELYTQHVSFEISNESNKNNDTIHKNKNKNQMFLEIPKENETYLKVEKTIYTQLLIKINEYKKMLFGKKQSDEKNELLSLLNKPLYTKSFIISNKYYKYDYNRYNAMTYLFFLNDCDGSILFENGTSILCETGTIVLFPAHIQYKYSFCFPEKEDMYIIQGQLCYDNIC
jgi:hypothetical protein